MFSAAALALYLLALQGNTWICPLSPVKTVLPIATLAPITVLQAIQLALFAAKVTI